MRLTKSHLVINGWLNRFPSLHEQEALAFTEVTDVKRTLFRNMKGFRIKGIATIVCSNETEANTASATHRKGSCTKKKLYLKNNWCSKTGPRHITHHGLGSSIENGKWRRQHQSLETLSWSSWAFPAHRRNGYATRRVGGVMLMQALGRDKQSVHDVSQTKTWDPSSLRSNSKCAPRLSFDSKRHCRKSPWF